MTINCILSELREDLEVVKGKSRRENSATFAEHIAACRRLGIVRDSIDKELAFLIDRINRLEQSNSLQVLLQRSEAEQRVLLEAREIINEAITVDDRATFYKPDKSGIEALKRAPE